jgi:hypothetical protein
LNLEKHIKEKTPFYFLLIVTIFSIPNKITVKVEYIPKNTINLQIPSSINRSNKWNAREEDIPIKRP